MVLKERIKNASQSSDSQTNQNTISRLSLSVKLFEFFLYIYFNNLSNQI